MAVSHEDLNGRAVEVSSATTFAVDFLRAKLWYVDVTAVSQQVRMPDATKLKPGGCVGVVAMQTASNTVTIADSAGTAITLSTGGTTITADQGVKMLLLDNSTAAGTWAGKVHDIGAAANPGPAELVYVQGGVTGVEQDIEEFNHQLDTFTNGTASGNQHTRGAAFRIGSALVVFGDNTAPQDKVERYTPSSDSWATLADFPSNFLDGQGASQGSTAKGYALGYVADRDGTREFDNGTEVWTAKSNKTSGCTDGFAVANGSDMLVASGNLTTTDEQQTFEKYISSTDTWTGLANQPAPAVSGHQGTIQSGEVVRLGGFATSKTDDVDVYSVSMDSWAAKIDFPSAASPEARFDAAMGNAETSATVFGGQIPVGSSAIDEVHTYNFAADTWAARSAMNDPRQSHQAATSTP